MTRPFNCLGSAIVVMIALVGAASAQDDLKPKVTRVSAAKGEMAMEVVLADPSDSDAVAPSYAPSDRLMFEPWQMLDELFRPDIVLLMRHGPTDWSRRDVKGVAPDDCAHQRLLSETGASSMRDLGILLSGNGIRPSKVVTSEWCRNRATVANLVDGFHMIDADYANTLEVQSDSGTNLLLSLEGAATVTPLRELVSAWDGEGRDGPLLIVSHFTNIAEFTEFQVYEGEILIVDPKRNNRVLGYLRLKSASPDVGHFENTDQ